MPSASKKLPTSALVRRPSDRSFAKATLARVSDMERLSRRLASGVLGLDEWADAFHAVLVRGHSDAYTLGRQRAGDLAAQTRDDERFGLDAADGQGERLQRFLDQLKAGDPRYFDEDGKLVPGSLDVRYRQYASRMRATSSEAFVDAGEPDDEYDWELGAAELHCVDCPELAALSPYTASTIISHPADGQTDCGPNCTCRLRRRRDKVAAFSRVDLYLS